jgi:hypothetical protein
MMFTPSADSRPGLRRNAALLLVFLASCAAPGAGSPPPNLTSAEPPAAEAAVAREVDAERLRQEVKRYGSSCEDVAALEQGAARSTEQSRRDVYAAAASKRRYEGARDIEVAVAKVVQDAQVATKAAEALDPSAPSAAATPDPDALRARLHDVLGLSEKLACYDVEAAKDARRTVEVAASALDAAVACRTSPSCRGGRLTGAICAALAVRDRATADDLKTEYRGLLHTPFDVGVCPKPAKDGGKEIVGSTP